VFSHGSFLTPSGAQLLRSTNQFISITPESEMHYGHDHPRNHLIQDQAALGIDTHMTFSTDILTQARIWLQSVRLTLSRAVLENWHVPSTNPMSVVQAFLLATRQGGLALRRPDLGVIREGAKADLVVWNGRSPGMLGWVDPVAAVMLHANVGDIKHVMVDGVFQKRNGSLTAKSYAELQSDFTKVAVEIQEVMRNTPYPVLDGEYLTYKWTYQPTTIVDVQRGDGDGYGKLYV
jgi:cytosine/adenosine deaminase-related metal-dependent hydrolase